MGRSVPKRVVALLAFLLPLQGCYYVQAAQGHFKLMSAREPIETVVADVETPEAVRERLTVVTEARQFAIEELGLPDNGSYTSYVDLGRDYVVVNVFAAPEFSLVPKRWCHPFVGCMAYLGYYAAEDANDYAQRLAREGWDTTTSKVRAYSTLGRFRDPVLSTMIAGSEDATVSLVFHELAHQVIYVRGDTAFNESFATFVASEGLRRWRAQDGRAAPASLVQRRAALRAAIARLRDALSAVYDGELPEAEKRTRKAALFEAFATEWTALGGRLPAPHNNAALAPIALYADRTAGFAGLLRASEGDLERFYAAVKVMGELEKPARDARLDALAAD
ncbi:MAG: aminopeptidase [Pseudomonadota bacterium]